jgi:hypothetical protein
MNTYIKIYHGNNTDMLEYQANKDAKANGAEIISASLSFSGGGRPYEEPILTVVFEKKQKKKKPAESGE